MNKRNPSRWDRLRKKGTHRKRRNIPPTPAQIILAVTAALLAFIASQLGG